MIPFILISFVDNLEPCSHFSYAGRCIIEFQWTYQITSILSMPSDNIPSNGAESPRPQADPLPSKRGEIGYIETVEPSKDILHPLDLYDLPTNSVDRIPPSPISPNAVIIPPAQSEVVTYPSSDQSSSTASITKPNGMLDFFKPQGPPALGGLRLYTLVIFIVQFILLGGTVTAWVFAAKRLALTAKENNQTSFGYPQTIAVHIIFIVIILIQIAFLERILSHLRDERYSYVHHGEIVPLHIPRSSVTSAFAPWNRPSLPTYAAALSQSGVATGDVEDHIIAIPPPPAYDNTRGSTLVLSGFSRNDLNCESGTGRPLSRDEQRDHVQTVRRLEETMDRLKPPSAAYIAR